MKSETNLKNVMLNITPKSMKFEGFRIQQLIILSHRDSEYGKLLPGMYESTPKKNEVKENYSNKLCALEQYTSGCNFQI